MSFSSVNKTSHSILIANERTNHDYSVLLDRFFPTKFSNLESSLEAIHNWHINVHENKSKRSVLFRDN
jgi:hypothetical protein